MARKKNQEGSEKTTLMNIKNQN